MYCLDERRCSLAMRVGRCRLKKRRKFKLGEIQEKFQSGVVAGGVEFEETQSEIFSWIPTTFVSNK